MEFGAKMCIRDGYEALLPGTRHLSTMPNTPVRVCAGVFLLEEKHSLTPEEYVLSLIHICW